MMNFKNASRWLFVLLISFNLNAQVLPWQTTFTYLSNSLNDQFGDLHEIENKVQCAKGGNFAEFSSLGKGIKAVGLLPGGSIFRKRTFFVSNYNDFNITASRYNDANDTSIFLKSFDSQSVGFDFALKDNLGDVTLKGPAVSQLENDEFFVFGNQYFYKMKVENNGNFTQLSQIPNNLGLISATARSGNDHIVCTESGNYALVNNTGGVIW